MSANNTNISSYSAADFMRYATGRMDSAEMYALEKAAMEDSFLAEALEGYMEAAATIPEQTINEQADRLNKPPEKQQTRVIPIWRRKIVQLAVAACFIAGAGWFVFSLLQKPVAKNDVAVVQKNNQQVQPGNSHTEFKILATDSSIAQVPAIKDTAFQSPVMVAQNQEVLPKPVAAPNTFALQQANNKDLVIANETEKNEVADMARADSTTAPLAASAQRDEIAMLERKEVSAMRKAVIVPQHTFRGRVTDANNNPLPYSNIMIDGQNFGTYSDAFGNFNFISDDSILPVRVRSVGYSNQLVALKEGKQEAKIVIQEDKQLSNNLALTVQGKSYRQPLSMKAITENDSIAGVKMVDLPYYDTYLLNNNRISQLPNLNRQVQLNFEVTPSGTPANITIVKSSGKALDEEAIRLIKEGPKLNPGNNTKSKRKVIVRF